MKNKKTFYGDVMIDKYNLKDSSINYPIELEYYKVSQNRTNIINEDYEIYGVEIIKKEYIEDRIETESMCVENLTKNEKTVDKIIKILKDNTVTPITLKDVINDMFKQ